MPMHLDHEAAHAWFGRHRSNGWATCPMTENGLVRVLSNPAYPGRRTTVGDAVARLELFRSSGDDDDNTAKVAAIFAYAADRSRSNLSTTA